MNVRVYLDICTLLVFGQGYVIFSLRLHLHVKLTSLLRAERTLTITFEYCGKQYRKLHSQYHINQILFNSNLVIAQLLFTVYIYLYIFNPTLGLRDPFTIIVPKHNALLGTSSLCPIKLACISVHFLRLYASP